VQRRDRFTDVYAKKLAFIADDNTVVCVRDCERLWRRRKTSQSSARAENCRPALQLVKKFLPTVVKDIRPCRSSMALRPDDKLPGMAVSESLGTLYLIGTMSKSSNDEAGAGRLSGKADSSQRSSQAIRKHSRATLLSVLHCETFARQAARHIERANRLKRRSDTMTTRAAEVLQLLPKDVQTKQIEPNFDQHQDGRENIGAGHLNKRGFTTWPEDAQCKSKGIIEATRGLQRA